MNKKLRYSILVFVIVFVGGIYRALYNQETSILNPIINIEERVGMQSNLPVDNNNQTTALRDLEIWYQSEQQKIVDDRINGVFVANGTEDERRQMITWSTYLKRRAEITQEYEDVIFVKESRKLYMESKLTRNRNDFNNGDGRTVEKYLNDAVDIVWEYQQEMNEMGFAEGGLTREDLALRVTDGRGVEEICNPGDALNYDANEKHIVDKACVLMTPILFDYLDEFEQNNVLAIYRI